MLPVVAMRTLLRLLCLSAGLAGAVRAELPDVLGYTLRQDMGAAKGGEFQPIEPLAPFRVYRREITARTRRLVALTAEVQFSGAVRWTDCLAAVERVFGQATSLSSREWVRRDGAQVVRLRDLGTAAELRVEEESLREVAEAEFSAAEEFAFGESGPRQAASVAASKRRALELFPQIGQDSEHRTRLRKALAEARRAQPELFSEPDWPERLVIGTLLWNLPRPGYPFQARKMRIQGTCICVIRTDATGRVVSAVMDPGLHEVLDDNVVKFALENWSGPPEETKRVALTYRMQE